MHEKPFFKIKEGYSSVSVLDSIYLMLYDLTNREK
jgi:hypothetical protein